MVTEANNSLKILQAYGFKINAEIEGLYDLIDMDYHLSKCTCVPYRFKDFSKYNLTKTQLYKYSRYVASKITLPSV